MDGVIGQDRYPDASQDRLFDRLIAAEFERNSEFGERPSRSLEGLLEAVTQPGSRLSQDERVGDQLPQRKLLPLAQGVAGRHDQHHAVADEEAVFQMRLLDFPPHQPEADFSPFYSSDRLHAVTDGGTNANMRVSLPKDREQGRKQVFAGDRTGGDQQFPGDRGIVSRNLLASFPMDAEYPLGVGVERLPRLGQHHTTPSTVEEALAEGHFEGVNTLAHRRLRQPECLRRLGEAARLRGLREGFQMGKLNVFGLHGITSSRRSPDGCPGAILFIVVDWT